MRRMPLLLTLLLVAGACSDLAESPVEPQLSLQETAADAHEPRTYRVTVTNLTTAQPFTPPLFVVHRRARLWRLGRPASTEVQQIAENGNLAPMLDRLAASPRFGEVVVDVGDPVPPLLPQESRSFEITAQPGERYFSLISMLICTNDGFTGLTRRRLPHRIGHLVNWHARAYDAGTEINTEDFSDLVPPCPPLTGIETSKMGTGMSNPELAENGRVRVHRGIHGVGDLIPFRHGWHGFTTFVEIERIH